MKLWFFVNTTIHLEDGSIQPFQGVVGIEKKEGESLDHFYEESVENIIAEITKWFNKNYPSNKQKKTVVINCLARIN